jgi:FkbM family methyltransferase
LVAAAARQLYPRFEPEMRWLDRLCPTGGTAVDVGAWYGPWTRRLARRADSVVTVEPMPHLAALLRRSVPANVRVVEAAASDHAGTATIWTSAEGRGVRGISSLVRRDGHTCSIEVPLVTLDSLELTGVTFVKMDVDGHEVPALRGARETLRREQPALLVEVEERIQPVHDIVDLLAGWDYQAWVLPERQWLPLSGFDLVGHQQRTVGVAEHGLLRRVIWPYPRYVNLVLFLPAGRQPPT